MKLNAKVNEKLTAIDKVNQAIAIHEKIKNTAAFLDAIAGDVSFNRVRDDLQADLEEIRKATRFLMEHIDD